MDIRKLLQDPKDRPMGYQWGNHVEFTRRSSAGEQEMRTQVPSRTLPNHTPLSEPREDTGSSSKVPSLKSGASSLLQEASPDTPPPMPSSSSFYNTNNHLTFNDDDYLPQPTGNTSYDDDQNAQEDLQALHEAGEGGSIAVDSDDMGTDAGYESDSHTSASTSLASSVRDYAFENGRRYHKFREGRYNFPNDDVEQEREDMKHAMVKMLVQQLHLAPIGDHPQEILDIGTGTGIWAIEMGDEYQSANVLGIDLSPIQPDWVPPNVKFMVDDVESPWLHPRNHFDYIHSRHSVMAIKDWPKLLRRSLEHLRPGGWIELQEVHHFPQSAGGVGSMPADHAVAQYWSLINQGLTNLGIDFQATSQGRLADMMRGCGYVNVVEKTFHVPIGTWPKNKVLKTVGLYWRCILLDGIQAIALGPLTRGCGWQREDVELFLIQVRKAYYDNSCLMYMPLHIVYGQRPEGDN